MSSANTLNYLARNARTTKRPRRTPATSPLLPKPKPNRKTRSISMSLPGSPPSPRFPKSMGNSCNVSCGQILIQDVDEEFYPFRGSRQMQRTENKASQAHQQNNLIAEYFRRVQILEQQTKRQEQLSSLKNCMDFRETTLRFDPLAQIDEEQESSLEEADMNQSVSPSSGSASLGRAKSKQVMETYCQQQIDFNPQKQLRKQQKCNNLQAEPDKQRLLKMLASQLPQEQLVDFADVEGELSQLALLKQKVGQQQKQRSTLRALNSLLMRKVNSQSYMLAGRQEEQVLKNRALIYMLVRKLTQ